ncbi:hypothetical protein [Anabaena sp. UHCC 0451]|uniref:hypothetical protein n=1 Tax=Anabaena sp. UHCC 0451 TaxID=2055235 RepID=UPI002B20936E|nr:hypothetical protein [Anabaena sp. UHCC 0451]MEA5574913.1 hypothetical protein [Anabaena sp. UHCC 0451]
MRITRLKIKNFRAITSLTLTELGDVVIIAGSNGIAFFADEIAVKNNFAQANEVFIPSIAVGELCYGARKSGRSKENLE